jgi:ubiquinone/menaquinone biosynthesis C-methylase UbiE
VNTTKKEYFNKVATKRIKQRKAKGYYWNDITKHCDYFIHEDYTVLEIGCGTGELLNDIKAKHKTGIDFSEEMINQARKQFPELELYVMDASSISLNRKYDLIILSNLIGYVDDIQEVLSNLHAVCNPNTKIIITYYNFLWEPLLKFGEFIGYKTKTPNQNWLSLSEINHLLFLSGFHVYRNSKRMILPVYIPLVSEVFNLFLGKFPLFRQMSINNFTFAKPLYESKPEEWKNKYSVSVVVPVCNEVGNIENLISRMPSLGNNTEIIFVESNSTDDSWNKIVEVQQKYSSSHSIKSLQITGKGKGEAVRRGFEIATGDIFMILDGDLTVAPEALQKFYDAIASGKGDFINGSRLVYPMEKKAMRFLNLLGNKFFSMAFTWLLDQPFKDTLCGTKVIFRKDYEKLITNQKYFGDFDPFGDFNLIFGAYKLNLCIVELPVHYRERTYGKSNISRFRHGFILLRMCFFAARKIKFR